MHVSIRIGTRGSALARMQASMVAGMFRLKHPDRKVEIIIVSTSGDRDQTSTLESIGGKGVFTGELEQALVHNEIDIAVHSMKDVTSVLAPGTILAGFTKAESICDVLVYKEQIPFKQIPKGAVIGTGSMRRKALLSRLRPDLIMRDIRGNVDTRLRKVTSGEVDGVLLSEAGLIRLGRTDAITHRFDPKEFYPAPGQGVITMQTRAEDLPHRSVCDTITDPVQKILSGAEFSFLYELGFDCRSPIGVHTQVADATITMNGFVSNPSTGAFFEQSAYGDVADHVAIGKKLAQKILSCI